MNNLAISISQECQIAEALIDNLAYALNKQVKLCFTEYPRDPKRRWLYLSSSMDSAYRALSLYVPFSPDEENTLLDERQFVRDANSANNQDAVRQCMNAYLAVFINAMSGE